VDFKKLMGKGNEGLPVCVVQFAKVKIFRGDAHGFLVFDFVF
jgi:hypothetical protein